MVRTLNWKKVREAVKTGRMLTLTTHAYFSDERDYIDVILNLFLKAAGKVDLMDRLAYCIHELANNAKKANTKRVYFQENGLDIHDESHYWIGMRNFRKDTVENIQHYLEKLKESDLYIKVQFKLNEEKLMVAVRNNVRLTEIERQKIEEKIIRGRQFDNMADAYASIEDTSEGAGLGIVMMIIMLRNLGLSDQIIRFFCNEQETFIMLTIPLSADNATAVQQDLLPRDPAVEN